MSIPNPWVAFPLPSRPTPIFTAAHTKNKTQPMTASHHHAYLHCSARMRIPRATRPCICSSPRSGLRWRNQRSGVLQMVPTPELNTRLFMTRQTERRGTYTVRRATTTSTTLKHYCRTI